MASSPWHAGLHIKVTPNVSCAVSFTIVFALNLNHKPIFKALFYSLQNSQINLVAVVLSSNHNAQHFILIRCKHSQRACELASVCDEWKRAVKLKSRIQGV